MLFQDTTGTPKQHHIPSQVKGCGVVWSAPWKITLSALSICVITDCMQHDSITVQSVHVILPMSKIQHVVTYFSASPYNNFRNFCNICINNRTSTRQQNDTFLQPVTENHYVMPGGWHRQVPGCTGKFAGYQHQSYFDTKPTPSWQLLVLLKPMISLFL